MTLQHNETHEKAEEELAVTEIKMPQRTRRKFATVVVAPSDGLKEVFLEMGADEVVWGGQTNNPSSRDFIKAFDKVNADYIFVLPNNGNIVMTAKQAKEMYKDAEIRVIESKNLGQGYSALSMLDYDIGDADAVEEQMKESMQGTLTGMVAKSVRDVTLNGVLVEKDKYMGFTDHTMLVCAETKAEAVCALAEKMGVEDKEFLIAVHGKGVTDEEKSALRSFMQEQYPHIDVYEIEGGQEVYDFLLIIE